MRLPLWLITLLVFPVAALAQTSPGLVTGQVPTAAQWNGYFAAKQDYNPLTPTCAWSPCQAAVATFPNAVLTTNAGSVLQFSQTLPASSITGGLGYTPLAPSNNLSDIASAPAARTNLGLGSLATQNASSVVITGGTITGMPTPSAGSDVANKSYVDSAVSQAVTYHNPADLATAAALPGNTYNNGSSGVGATLTATSNGALTVDGAAVSNGQRILVKNEATAANNGVYTVTSAGSVSTTYVLTRSTDFNSSSNITTNSYFLVTGGSTNIATAWVMTTSGAITVGTTGLSFTQTAASQSYSAGTGMQLVGSTFSLSSGAAVGNLGYTPANVADNLSDLAAPYVGLANLGGGSPTAVTATGAIGVTDAETYVDWSPTVPAAAIFTLPASPHAGEQHHFKDLLATGGFGMEIAANSGQTIDGEPYIVLVTPNDSAFLNWNATTSNWDRQ